MAEIHEILGLDALKVTEKTAIACHKWIGKGDEWHADQEAVTMMRHCLNQMNIDGQVVIGEGERDKAPMLYIGEKLGNKNGPKIDIAVDPLEGTTICAQANYGSICVLAMSEENGLLKAPDIYMEKIAIGLNFSEYIIDLDNSPKENLRNLALAKSCRIEELQVVILNRPRHEELIAKVREAGARIRLISDGDISPILEASFGKNTDIYMGIGGAPEGVLAASALKSIGGQMMSKLIFSNDEEKLRAKNMGIKDFSKKYILEDLVSRDVIFVATGVTDGGLLKAVKINRNNKFVTSSIITSSYDKSVRFVENYM